MLEQMCVNGGGEAEVGAGVMCDMRGGIHMLRSYAKRYARGLVGPAGESITCGRVWVQGVGVKTRRTHRDASAGARGNGVMTATGRCWIHALCG